MQGVLWRSLWCGYAELDACLSAAMSSTSAMATHHFRDAITPLLLRSTGDAVVDAVHRIGSCDADAELSLTLVPRTVGLS